MPHNQVPAEIWQFMSISVKSKIGSRSPEPNPITKLAANTRPFPLQLVGGRGRSRAVVCGFFCVSLFFVLFDSLHPIQQYFSYVCFPGLSQLKAGINVSFFI